jgi:hypothetical protein
VVGGPPGLFGGRHPGSSLPVAEPACAVRSRCGGPWNSYARRAASHSLAKILDSRIERVGGFDRSRRAGDLELIRIAAHDRAAIDEVVEHERKAAPGEQFRPVKQAEMQMWGGGVAGVAELADSIPSSDAFAWLNGYAARLHMRIGGIDICRELKNDVIAAIVPGRVYGDRRLRRRFLRLAVADRDDRAVSHGEYIGAEGVVLFAPVSSPPPRAYEVCCWHIADVQRALTNVCFRG